MPGKQVRLSAEELEFLRNHRLERMAKRMVEATGHKPSPTVKPEKKGLDLVPEPQQSGLDISWGFKEMAPPYILEGRKVGVISDIHVPSHDKQALEAALIFLKKQGIDTLVINGDFMDLYEISDHDKDKLRKITFGDELEEGRIILGQIRDYFGKDVKIVYQEGNHEERYNRFLPAQLAGDKVRGSTMREQLELDKHDIIWVDKRRGIDLGKLRIFHGHEMRASGVNATRAMIVKALDNVLVGHLHRQQELMKPRLRGDYIGAWVTGCLCDKTPFYAVTNEWTTGFALVDVEQDGTFAVHLHSIINGVVR